MASSLTNASTMFPHKETYVYNILTAVPSGASQTDTITDLPAGIYKIYLLGIAAGASDSTISLSVYLNSARTSSMTLVLSTTTAAGTETVSVAPVITVTGMRGFVCGGGTTAANTSIIQPIPIPYGILWTYTKVNATTVNFTLVLERVG